MTEYQAMILLLTRGEIPFNFDMSFDEMLSTNESLPVGHPLKVADTSNWDRAYWEACQVEWRARIQALMEDTDGSERSSLHGGHSAS